MKVRRRTKNILVTLPVSTVEKLDELKEETELDRSEILEALLKEVLNDNGKIDQLFGVVEEDGEEDEEELEEEED
jgi:metal-responsive CopG/Arc/MetJ family transcriptional regulator|tara:strand:+ start:201 stop:425 length:225 start_codon:yes stop_codon:yes gene_type:complete